MLTLKEENMSALWDLERNNRVQNLFSPMSACLSFLNDTIHLDLTQPMWRAITVSRPVFIKLVRMSFLAASFIVYS